MDFTNRIEMFRDSQDIQLLQDLKFQHNGIENYYETGDLNYEERAAFIFQLYEIYTKEDKPLIKWLIKEEIEYSRIAGCSISTLDVCAFMLYKYFESEDIYLLYEAKFESNFDNSFTLDVELIFGVSKDEMKLFLANDKLRKEDSLAILEMIEHYEMKCKDIPNAFKSRKEYIKYFETKKINTLRE